jgi:hypothetical protein
VVGWLDEYYLLETTNGFPEYEDGHNFVPKPDVANTYVTFEGPRTGHKHDPTVTVYSTMLISVENAYPQYDVHLTAFLKNAGTIPACLYKDFDLYFYDVKDGQVLAFRLDDFGFDGLKHWFVGAIVDPVVGDIINFSFTIGNIYDDIQMEPCTSTEVDIDIDFTQEAEECHTYEFEVTMLAIQWNKLYEAPSILP